MIPSSADSCRPRWHPGVGLREGAAHKGRSAAPTTSTRRRKVLSRIGRRNSADEPALRRGRRRDAHAPHSSSVRGGRFIHPAARGDHDGPVLHLGGQAERLEEHLELWRSESGSHWRDRPAAPPTGELSDCPASRRPSGSTRIGKPLGKPPGCGGTALDLLDHLGERGTLGPVHRERSAHDVVGDRRRPDPCTGPARPGAAPRGAARIARKYPSTRINTRSSTVPGRMRFMVGSIPLIGSTSRAQEIDHEEHRLTSTSRALPSRSLADLGFQGASVSASAGHRRSRSRPPGSASR